MTDTPVVCRWENGVFTPATNFQMHLAGGRYEEGQLVALTEFHARSDKSHDHYFATLHDQWMSLPESLVADFPNAEVLRAHALIRTGYCNKRQLVCRSKAEAERTAAFLRPSVPLAIVEVDGCVVTEWTAESQAYRAMGKKRFQESKDAVLGYVDSLLERRVAA